MPPALDAGLLGRCRRHQRRAGPGRTVRPGSNGATATGGRPCWTNLMRRALAISRCVNGTAAIASSQVRAFHSTDAALPFVCRLPNVGVYARDNLHVMRVKDSQS